MIDGNRMAYFPFSEGTDGASGALAEGEIYVPTRHGAVVYMSVEDLDAVLERATRRDSEILFPNTAVGDEIHVAELEDSEGNRIAVQSAW